jgi:transcriptional regulator with XRE-family HTH domain
MSRPTPKALNKRYRTTSEMLEDIGASQESIDSVKEVEKQVAVPLLAGLRVSKGLTQKELAQAIGCSQGRISKLETACDEEVRLQDFIDYTRATKQGVWITIGPPTIAEHIKLHTRALRQLFEELVAVAGEDERIRDGVDRFLDEILVETGRLAESAKAAIAKKEKQKPEFDIWVIEQKFRVPEFRTQSAKKAS